MKIKKPNAASQILQKYIRMESIIEQKDLFTQENPNLKVWFFLEMVVEGPNPPRGLEVRSA